MSLFRKTARDISIVGGSHLVMWIATFVFTVAQARYLGPIHFGELSLALSYTALFTMVVDFGLSMQLSRLVAQGTEELGAAVGATCVLRVALWLLTLPLAWLSTTLLGYGPDLQQAIFVLALSVLLGGMASTMAAILQGREEFSLLSVGAVSYRVAAAIVGVVVLLANPQIGAIAWAFVAAAAVNVAVLLVGMRRGPPVPVRIDLRTTARILRGGVPLGLYWIVATFYFNVDMVLLQRLAAPENVGWYAAAYRLFSTTGVVPGIVTVLVLFPMFSRLSVTSRDELRRVIGKAFAFLAPAGCLVAVVMVVLADGIVTFVYPAQSYAPAATALRFLAPAVLLVYVNSVFAYSLFALREERRLLGLAALAAVLNPLANLVAIPLLQEDGAALVTSLTELLLLGGLVRMMPRDLVSRASLGLAARSLAAAAVTAVALLPLHGLGLVLTLPLSVVTFGGAALALRVFSIGDLRALLGVVRPPAPLPVAPPMHEEVA